MASSCACGNGCVCEIARLIDSIQRQACPISCNVGCEREVLGPTAPTYNTRVTSFYLTNGALFEAKFNINGNEFTTTAFRIERVNNCCCKLRCLLRIDDEMASRMNSWCNCNYVATNVFCTIDTCLCLGIQCIEDCFLDI